MACYVEGTLVSKEIKIGIVTSRFNDFITSRLLSSSIDTFIRHGGSEEDLTIVQVPGSFEIPAAANKLALNRQYDAIVCLGCLIKGVTTHFEYIACETIRGIGHINIQTGVPTIFGIITANTMEQAIERAGLKQGNQGSKAMLAAIEMANLMKQLDA